jgi:putative oxidoreductase
LQPTCNLAAAAPNLKIVSLRAVDSLIGLFDRVPYALLALPLRVGAATVFWNSAMPKLANWDTTIELFTDEYRVPLLPPELAANLALAIELTTPVLLVLGVLTRAAAIVLLGMTTVIEIFVYPQAWPTHIQWAAMLLVLLCRGAGTLSLDHVAWPRVRRLGGEAAPAGKEDRINEM